MRIYLEINSDGIGCIMVHKKQAYGTMHRKANKLFVCIREGFACACSRRCRKANVMFIQAFYTVYPVWFIFKCYLFCK